ncbi:unnamed protein product [Urochloa humidicola]
MPMELKSSSYLHPDSSTLPSSTRRNSFHGVGAATASGGGRGVGGGGGGNVFGPTFSDPLCSLNLKETSEFVRSSFPMATMARSSSSNGHHHESSSSTTSSSSSTASARRQPPPQVVPATPGRPLQFFSSPAAAHHQLDAPRRSVPSKWEDAEKWLRHSSYSDHHSSGNGKAAAAFSRQQSSGLGQRGGDEEKRAAAAVAVRRSVDALSDAHALALLAPPPAEVLLEYKFTDNEEPSKETFVFRSWRRRCGHLGAGGVPPREAGPGGAIRRHACQLELQGGRGRGGVQEPPPLRGHRRRRRWRCAAVR